jgi:prephenate dehydrogenase
MSRKTKIGIVGWGSFSQFIAPILAQYAEVYIYVREGKESTLQKELLNKNSIQVGTDTVLQELDYFIFSVPLQALEDTCKRFKKILTKRTVIIDVTSVQVKPVQILKKHFKDREILSTHPIFGPQSGKNGVTGLPIVLSNISLDQKKYTIVKTFLAKKIGLLVIEKTPDEHDREIAYIQGLSHFIGRALKMMNISDYDIATKSYRQLIGLTELLKDDSFELYKTIQKGNPYTKKLRKQFIKTLEELEEKIK